MATAEVAVDQDIKNDALALAEQAQAMRVTSASEYEEACTLGRELAGRIVRVEEYFKPLVSAAHEAHKRLAAARDAVLKPLEQAKRQLSQAAANYQLEEKKRADAAAERLRLQAIREEEDRRLAQAEALQAEGRKEEAEAVLEEEAIPVPVVAATTANVPKVQGVSRARPNYKFRIVNENLIPREYMKPDESKIGGVVRAMGPKASIPGIEIYNAASVSFRS